MELSQLAYFRAVARTEHFTRAAEELHITQPSLSKAIANLEGSWASPVRPGGEAGPPQPLWGRLFRAGGADPVPDG